METEHVAGPKSEGMDVAVLRAEEPRVVSKSVAPGVMGRRLLKDDALSRALIP